MDLHFISQKPLSYIQCTFYCAVDLFSIIHGLYRFVGDLFSYGVHTVQKKIWKCSLGLQSIPIHHRKGVFENTAWKCRLLISMWTENENWAFQKCWLTHDNHVIFLTAISSNTDSKWPLIFAFSNSTLYCGQKTFDVFWEWNLHFQILRQGMRGTLYFGF